MQKKKISYKYISNYNHLAMEHQWPNFTSICQLVTAMVLSGEENKWLLIYWEAIRKIRSNPPQITHQVTIWMEGKNKQMYMETSEPSCLTRRSQRSWTLQGTKKLQVWGAQILPYHHWVVINQIRISLFLLKKKNHIIPPKIEVSMNMALHKALYKNYKSASPIFF